MVSSSSSSHHKTLITSSPATTATTTIVVQEQQQQHLSMFFYKRLFRPTNGLNFILVLACIIFFLSTCGSCATMNYRVADGMMDGEACGSYGDSYDNGVRVDDDISANYVLENSSACPGLKTICANSELFCFPSTLPGFLDEVDNCREGFAKVPGSFDDATLPEASISHDLWETNSSWLLDYGTFILLNGRTVSCSLNAGKEEDRDALSSQGNNLDGDDSACRENPLACNRPYPIPDKSSKLIKSDLLDGSAPPHVEISPPFLDWGQSYLYQPLVALLTVANTCNQSVLHIYEPFSTDAQFYPCDFDEVILGPGEVASICFVFLPRRLGSISARLVLQTSSGGFLVQAKGLAIESLYRIQPLVGLNIYSNGRWSKNLSLHNPFDDTLYVKEVTATVSVCSGNTSHSAKAVCKMDSFKGSDQLSSFLNANKWLDIKSDQVDLPLMGIRPHRSWEIAPHSTVNIIEIDFLSGAQGKVFGTFCLHLGSTSHDRTDTVIVPLEAHVHVKPAYSDLRAPISVSLESLVPCDDRETTDVVLSLRNGAAYLLSVTKISEVTENAKVFHIKYMDGLLLFPGALTRIAVVTYTRTPADVQEYPHKHPDISSNCILCISTNDSSSPLIEIPCQDVINTCTRHKPVSQINKKLQDAKSKSGSTIESSLGSGIQSPSQVTLKALEIAEADELVLRNWRSQGSSSGMSILDDDEILFPVVEVGSHSSKWISVKNPSAEPVIMQLIMNTGAIIDHCRSADKVLQQPLSSSFVQDESTRPSRDGFSVADTAIKEAYVHPYGRALLGPIVFHPSKRCGWRGSAVIRNNLSGVEWLPLRGFGGSLSLVLLDGFVQVKSLEFNLSMQIPFNVAPTELLHNIEDKRATCSMPLSKELYAKNTGDLPLEVRRIEVSGTVCGLDGFTVHTCKSFSLEPGESRKLLVSYQTDFSAAVVYRDLELALATGILVIPMKANLPVYMLSLCRSSLFWILLKKLFLVVFVAASVMFLVFFCIFPQVMALGSQDYLFKTEIATISRTRKPCCIFPNQRNNWFSMCNYNDSMLSSVREDETSKLGFVDRYSDCASGVQEQRITAQHMKNVCDFQEQVVCIPGFQNETPALPYSSEAKSVAIVETPVLLEAQQSGNLTVKTGRERGRRRRRRRAAGAGVAGLLEVSSSQSGNSTPSSPMSPILSLTPIKIAVPTPDVDHVIEARNPFAKLAGKNCNKEHVLEAATGLMALETKVSAKCRSSSSLAQPTSPVPRKTMSKPVLLPSATFPGTSRHVPGVVIPSPYLTSTSPVTPNARAPGSNLCKETSIKVEEKTSHRDEFTYDIWGNHFSGFHLVGKDKVVSTMISDVSGGDSLSFFARGPQVLMQKSQARSVSPAHKLPPCAVTRLLGKG